MLECINKDCPSSKEGECILDNNKSHAACVDREFNVSKENICYNGECPRNNKNGLCLLPIAPTTECKNRDTEQPIPINYEEEYHKIKKELETLIENEKLEENLKIIKLKDENYKLKKENEELKARNSNYEARLKNQEIRIKTDGNQIQKLFKEIEEYKQTNKGLVEEIKNKNINYQVNIEELSKEIDRVMEEKEKLKESNFINYNEYKEHLKKKDEHIIDLNQLIEKKDIKIEELEKQIEELQKVNKEINDSRELMHEEILKLEKEIDDWNDLEAEKEKELAELKRELEKANDLNRNINNQNARLRKEVEEGNEVLENEYHNKIFIAEQKINTLSTEVACLKAFKEKDNKQIQNLKDTIKSMAAAL